MIVPNRIHTEWRLASKILTRSSKIRTCLTFEEHKTDVKCHSDLCFGCQHVPLPISLYNESNDVVSRQSDSWGSVRPFAIWKVKNKILFVKVTMILPKNFGPGLQQILTHLTSP